MNALRQSLISYPDDFGSKPGTAGYQQRGCHVDRSKSLHTCPFILVACSRCFLAPVGCAISHHYPRYQLPTMAFTCVLLYESANHETSPHCMNHMEMIQYTSHTCTMRHVCSFKRQCECLPHKCY